MSLQAKVHQLKLEAALAARHATFWQRAIEQHGETKATEFYSHLGLNHLEKKSFDWEGLTLSREPKEHEKIAIKGIHAAQESSKDQITKVLLEARKSLISDGLKGIKKLSPAQYHELSLSVSSEHREGLRDRLITTYHKGRDLVSRELTGRPKGKHVPSASELKFRGLGVFIKQDDEDFDDLDTLTDLTDSRLANDVASRVTAAATRYRLLGLTGAALWKAVEKEVSEGSTGYVDRAATGAANRTINQGRSDEAQERSGEWETVEYSAILDQNVCSPCSQDDGQSSTNEADLTPAPNPDCEGGDWCRCFHVFLSQ